MAKLAEGYDGEPVELTLLGRKLLVPHAAHSGARFNVLDLADLPLGAPDFLAIAQNFGTVFVEQVQIFKASERNQTKRFILMIDTLYDA